MLIEADAVICMDPQRRVLQPGWVEVRGPDIVAVGEGRPPADAGQEVRRADLVVPGLVSAHQHLVDVCLRGAHPGPDFLTWLLDTYYAGLAGLSPEDCGIATAAALATTMEAGVTTVVDCWGIDHGSPTGGRSFAAAECSLEVHARSGARVLFARMFAERAPASWAGRPGFPVERVLAPATRQLDEIATLAGRHHGRHGGRIRIAPSPELPEMVSLGSLSDAWSLARELEVPLPMHVCASPDSRAAWGPDELADLGLLGPDLLAAHCIELDDRDVAAFGAAGVAVAHCPRANLALGSTTTRAAALRRAGAVVGLGLDNASLVPRLDLLGEARAARLAASTQGDELSASDVLAMATIDGARAVGLGHVAGSIEPGKRADMVLVDTSGSHWWPHERIDVALIEQARGSDVRTVLVDGRIVVDDGRCTTLEIDRAALAAVADRARTGVVR